MKTPRVDPAAPVVYSVVRHTTAQDAPIVVTFARDPDVLAVEALTAADRVLSNAGALLAVSLPAPKENATPV